MKEVDRILTILDSEIEVTQGSVRISALSLLGLFLSRSIDPEVMILKRLLDRVDLNPDQLGWSRSLEILYLRREDYDE